MLEKLAEVCSGFYVMARDAEFWRMSCLRTWGVRMGILDETYPSWREMYIYRPHVWHNGVYISKITYVRHGEASFQDRFYRPWHLVVYYRYLRFFANGCMLMLTTADEPENVLHYLRTEKPRYQGVISGTYRLVGKDSLTADMVRTKKNQTESNHLAYPYQRRKGPLSPYEPMQHAFVMQLRIGSTRKRKHIQLTWLNYESTVTYRSGQETKSKFDLNEQNFPPLYYSRVRSFSAESELPLDC